MKKFQQKPSHIIMHHSAVNDNPRKCDRDFYKHFHTSYVFDGHIVTEQEYYKKLEEPLNLGKYHRKPWDDIGYHFVIERNEIKMYAFTPFLGLSPGVIIAPTIIDTIQLIMNKGRDTQYTGIHARGTIGDKLANDVSLGVCLSGNFDSYHPDDELWTFAAVKVAGLCEKFDIHPSSILGHNDVQSSKSCPGRLFNVGAFRETVEVYLY